MRIDGKEAMVVGVAQGCFVTNLHPLDNGKKEKGDCRNPGLMKCLFINTMIHHNWIDSVINSRI